VATQPKKQWPTWMIAVAIFILIPPIVWALTITVNLLTAMSIGGILVVVGIVALFIVIKRRVDEER
jgi:nitrate reductase gamma subunit